MFKKLNISLSDSDIAKIQSIPEFVNPTGVFSNADKKCLFDILSSKICFTVPPDVVSVTQIQYPGAIPHTDSWRASVNLYFDVDNDETNFWEEIVPTNPSKTLTRGRVPYKDMSNLKNTGSFVAQRGDCYLIDISSIHSIKMQTPGSIRKLIRIGWHEYSLDQIESTFKFL